jgi:putative transposase
MAGGSAVLREFAFILAVSALMMDRRCVSDLELALAGSSVRSAREHMFVRIVQAYRFALAPTPRQQRKLASHTGAARFAYNFALALVKERMDVRAAGGGVEVPWTLPALRREWNRNKQQVAPWWAENSKEAASSGLADLAAGLKAFSESKRGQRAGARVGFPGFKRRGRTRESFRYTTGRFGVSDRTRVQLPRIGHIRTHEPTTKLLEKIKAGRARILSMTVSRESGRWYCSLCCEVERDDRAPRRSVTAIGVDVGVRNLAVLSTGERIANPRALEYAQRRLRRYQRRLDRQRRHNNPGCFDACGRAVRGTRAVQCSRRMDKTQSRVRKLHTRASNIRGNAIHNLTSRLAGEFSLIVVERLNVRGLCRSGHAGLRRALHDAALAEIRRQLAYKTAWHGGTLIEAPTFYPSSKICSACGTAKTKLPLSDRTFRCARCGFILDRDENAARNLEKLGQHVAASGAETENARSPTHIRPGSAGRRVDREAGSAPAAHETGAACEQPQAARSTC